MPPPAGEAAAEVVAAAYVTAQPRYWEAFSGEPTPAGGAHAGGPEAAGASAPRATGAFPVYPPDGDDIPTGG